MEKKGIDQIREEILRENQKNNNYKNLLDKIEPIELDTLTEKREKNGQQ